ncbi:MAG: hypothetical protein QXU32_03300 [Nitrososphaerales archaeon]
MADFTYLEEVAARIKANREHLFKVDEELSNVNARIHELPLKSQIETSFAKMIGIDYHDELGSLEKVRDELVRQRDLLVDMIEKDKSTFIEELASPDLVIPVEPVPVFKDGNTTYSFRDGMKFTNLFGMLSEVLGLSLPMVVKDVMLSPSEIVIKANEEFEAKKKFLNAVSEIQKTLSIKKK